MSDKVCLGLHGFTGGPFELTPLARYLENAGWTCLLPTLPGHEQPDGLKQVRWSDWLEAAEREAQRLTERYGSFDLVGFSMGGALAAHIANRYPVRRLVLLNAAVIYASPYLLLQDFGSAFQAGDWRRYMKIRRTPLRATVQFMRLVRSAKPMWKGIGAPTMIAQSGRDPVVHPHSASVLASLIPSAARVDYYPASKHLICLDREADTLFARIGQFLSDETGP